MTFSCYECGRQFTDDEYLQNHAECPDCHILLSWNCDELPKWETYTGHRIQDIPQSSS